MRTCKKIISLILINTLCLTILGCSTSQSKKQTTNKENAKFTLTIAARDGSYSDVINAVKGDFESTNNCYVEVVSLSSTDIHDNTIADVDNENGIYDVIMIDDPLMPEYIEKDVLVNLTKLGYADDDDFVEKSRLLGKDPYPLGATYALPFSGNVQLLFYNEDVLGKDVDLTNWDSLYEACSKAKQAGKNGYALRGQTGNPIVSDFLPILWAFGGDIFDSNNHVVLDSEESRKALEFYCKLYETGDLYDKDGLVSAVTEAEAGLALGWPSWFISGENSSVSIAQIPGKATASSPVNTTGEIGNWLLGVTSNSSNPDLALKLVEYLTSKQVQYKALSYGGIPTRISVFKDPTVLKDYPHFEQIYSGTNNSRVRPRTTKWSQIEDVFGAELVKCINGEQSIDDTITNSQEAIILLGSQ